MIISAHKSYVMLLMACSLLAGCQMQPDYKRPDVSLPDVWNSQYSGQVYRQREEKKAFYSDANLRVIINLALKHNLDLKEAVLNLKKAQELYGIQKLALLPAVNASFSQTSAHEPDGLLDTTDTGALTYHQYDAKLVSASWELDFWGRLRSLKDSALNDYLATKATARALKLTVISQAASSYLTFLAGKANLRLAEQKVSNLRTMLSMQVSAWQLGDISRETLLDYEVALRQQEQEMASLRTSVQKEYDALQLLLGGKAPDRQMNSVTFTDITDLRNLQPALPASVLLQRPDVIAAEFRMKQANADIGAARAAFFPSISLTASGGSASAELKDLFSAGTAAWSFSPSVTLPIFNNGRNKANLRAAETTQQVAAADYEKVIQQSFRDTSDALAGRQSQQVRYAQSEGLFAVRDKAFTMAQLSVRAGDRSRFDCLQAKNALLDAKKELTESRLQLLLQEIQLHQSLGGNGNPI